MSRLPDPAPLTSPFLLGGLLSLLISVWMSNVQPDTTARVVLAGVMAAAVAGGLLPVGRRPDRQPGLLLLPVCERDVAATTRRTIVRRDGRS